jgi:hypothetical protein
MACGRQQRYLSLDDHDQPYHASRLIVRLDDAASVKMLSSTKQGSLLPGPRTGPSLARPLLCYHHSVRRAGIVAMEAYLRACAVVNGRRIAVTQAVQIKFLGG